MAEPGILAAVGAAGVAVAVTAVMLPPTSGSTPPTPVTVIRQAGDTAQATPFVSGRDQPPAAQPDTAATVQALPLPDLIYLIDIWSKLEEKGPSASFVLGSGYGNPVVYRDTAGVFFAGTIERTNSAGEVSDVILAFNGATPAASDLATDAALLLGTSSPEARKAVTLFDAIMADSRYAAAKIHLGGHSMGSGLADWVFAHALTAYGADAVYPRVTVTNFGDIAFGRSIMAHFGLTEPDLAGHIVAYSANDDLFFNGLVGGMHLGVQHRLADYGTGPVAGTPNTDAHSRLVAAQGIGLPAWLSASQRSAIITEVSAAEAYNSAYGMQGGVAQDITGDSAANVIAGTRWNDVIAGGRGADRLWGGEGADRFVLRDDDSPLGASDVITDFAPEQGDTIDVSAVDARRGTIGSDRFQFVGQQMPTRDGQLGFYLSGGRTVLVGRVGGGAPDLVFVLDRLLRLSSSDLVM